LIATCAALIVALSRPVHGREPAAAGSATPERGWMTTPADRSTPRRAMAAFLEAAEARDYAPAADVLDLNLVAPAERSRRGPELAEMLHHVLERTVWIDPATLSYVTNGSPGDGVDTERVGSVRVGKSEIPVMLSRSDRSDRAWSISAATVARIPR